MHQSRTFDVIALTFLTVICFAVIVIGGLDLPNTPAGQVAKFVFSLK